MVTRVVRYWVANREGWATEPYSTLLMRQLDCIAQKLGLRTSLQTGFTQIQVRVYFIDVEQDEVFARAIEMLRKSLLFLR